MKTPRFWYPAATEASLLPEILSPLSYGFRAGGFLRRAFANPYHAQVPVICVGNVVAGGAGKTPTALALAHILKAQGHRPVFVTRGYGGHGWLTCVDRAIHTSRDVGDEALLLAAVAPTWVARDRIAAVRQAENHGTVIIMDDGLQNPHIASTSSLLVIDGGRGIGNGHVIPAGPLRETLQSAVQRVKAVVIIGEDKQKLAGQITEPVFHAHIMPQLAPGFPIRENFVAFAGIAYPQKFYDTARQAGLMLTDTWDFPDHHVFTDTEINELRLWAAEQGARLLTTEKDAVRLPAGFRDEPLTLPVTLGLAAPGDEQALAKLLL